MKSPFPGMDPYLEAHWPDVHASLAIFAREQLRPQMPAGLIVRVEEYMSISADEPRKYAPDVRVHDLNNGAGAVATSQGGLAVAQPFVIPLEIEPATLRSVRILDTQSGDQIVTAVEFLSPANKSSPLGRRKYVRKRQDLLDAGANLVEIDLIRAGGDVFADTLDDVAPDYRAPYRICVLRMAPHCQAELYRASFKERLPAIRIPLREHDADAVLDVQDLVERSYEGGQYERTIDYRLDPAPPMTRDDLNWLDEWLRGRQRR